MSFGSRSSGTRCAEASGRACPRSDPADMPGAGSDDCVESDLAGSHSHVGDSTTAVVADRLPGFLRSTRVHLACPDPNWAVGGRGTADAYVIDAKPGSRFQLGYLRIFDANP